MIFRNKKLILELCFIAVTIFILTTIVESQPPKDFPLQRFYFHISKGSSISKIADDLYTKKVISSELLFKVSAKILSLTTGGVQAGDYKFVGKENTIEIAYRMAKGYQRQEKIRVTIPEGTNIADMAFTFMKALPNFNAPHFVSITKKDEGYLYPDTYDFFENANAEDVARAMKDNFNQKILSINDQIKSSKRSLKDIIIMASIVEKEVTSTTDRKIVSGILWKRIDKGMLLQVDPPFYYISEKTGGVSYDDLKIDSPYNTYKYKGLPPGPIDSPSLDAIQATINPTETKYYFYLSGKDGATRYAETYDGHLRNKSLYLK